MRVACRVGLVSVLVILGLSGCVSAPKLITGELLAPVESETLCSSLNAVRDRSASFRALLDTTVTSPMADPVSFRYAIVGKDPEMLRIDVLPPEGAYTLALITVRGSQAQFLDSQSKRVTQGCSVNQVLDKFLGLRGMTPTAIEAIVVGQVPRLECARVVVNRLGDNRYLFIDISEQIAWEIDASTGELFKAHFLDSNGVALTALASRELRGADSFIVVSVYDPVKAIAEMRIARLTRNPEVADSTFSVAVPSEYEREGC